MNQKFNEMVRDEFSNLEDKYKLIFSEVGELEVDYENDFIVLRVVYDGRRSHVLDVYLKRKNLSNETQMRDEFTLADLLIQKSASELKELGGIQISDKNILKKFLGKISVALQKYGHEIFTGDLKTFQNIREVQLKRIREYEYNEELNFIRKKAQEAWDNKDYQKYFVLLEPLKEELTELERKRLLFSEKKIRAELK